MIRQWGGMFTLLHSLLTNKLDPVLFRQPYFNTAELANYQIFPLSGLRSLNYSYLIAWPTMAKRRRFKALNSDIASNWLVRNLCRVHIATGILAPLICIFYFASGGYVLFFT